MAGYPNPEYALNMESGKMIEHHLGRQIVKYLTNSSTNSFGGESGNQHMPPAYPTTSHPLDVSTQRFSPVSIGSLYGSAKYIPHALKIPTTFRPTTRQSPNDISACEVSQTESTTKRNSTLSKSCDELRMITGQMNNVSLQSYTTPSYEERIALNSDHMYTINCQSIKSKKCQELNNKQGNNNVSGEYNNPTNGEQRIWLLSNNKTNKPGILLSPNNISDYQRLENIKYPSILRKSDCCELMLNSSKNNDIKPNNWFNEQQHTSYNTRQITGYNKPIQNVMPTTLLSAHSLKCLNIQKSFV